MSAASTVRLKVDVDTDDAIRKLRQVKREAHGLRRSLRTGSSRWTVVTDLLLEGFGVGYGVVGLLRHDTFDVATGALFLCLVNRR